jgi:hypothetical protein
LKKGKWKKETFSKMNILLAIILFGSFFFGCARDPKGSLTLSPQTLYNSYKARRIGLSGDKGAVGLDLRNIKSDFTGEIVTDVIDLTDPDNSAVAPQAIPEKICIRTKAKVPKGTRVELFLKTGPAFFSNRGWTRWQKAEKVDATFDNLAGPYVQLRFLLTTGDKSLSPQIMRVEVKGSYGKLPAYARPVQVIAFENEKIITSPYEFGWETRDNPAIQAFVKKSGAADVVKTHPREFDKFEALNNWAAKTENTRHGSWRADYPWDIDEIYNYKNGKGTIKGHCMSYAVVLITALSGLGHYARHWCVDGFRDMGHEVVEVWSNDLKKWIYFDPSLDEYYASPGDSVPLSILEMHNIFVSTFFKEGEDLFMPKADQKKRVKKIGGKNAPILSVKKEGYSYGRLKADHDWGWYHGYLADGFMRLTMRNNFHSQREPWFPHFGEGVADFDVFLSWMDKKTPPRSEKITRFSGRERDFYWTLNQAVIKAKRTGEKTVLLEFGNSMPFFKQYKVTVDDQAPVVVPADHEWKLHEGENTLLVLPEDNWGTPGIPSQLKVRY